MQHDYFKCEIKNNNGEYVTITIVSEFCKCYLDSETKPEMKEVFKAHIKTSLKGKSVDFLQKS